MLFSNALVSAVFFFFVSHAAVIRGRQGVALSSPDLPAPNGSIGAAASVILAGTAPSAAANPGGKLF
jgi:hypothetical protein